MASRQPTIKLYQRCKVRGFKPVSELVDEDFEYIVYSATNITSPRINETLTRAQVDALIARRIHVTITRKPAEKR